MEHNTIVIKIKIAMFQKNDLMTKENVPVKGFTLLTLERVVNKKIKK